VHRSREPTRVALLHPQSAWVEALESLLVQRSDIETVIAHTSPDWVRSAVAAGVEVLVLGLWDADGFRPRDIKDLRRRATGLQVVVVSDSDDTELFVATVRAGARGWLHPGASVEELVRAIHGVARGETHAPPALMTLLLEALLTSEDTKKRAQDVLSVLSAREREILECLAQGMTRPQIGQRFTLSPHTVRTHINHVLTKLHVHNTLSAVSIARKAGVPSRPLDVSQPPGGGDPGRRRH
jgi:DNA-binding NarL/FixJ family response regulator